jgi:hypothetical protein
VEPLARTLILLGSLFFLGLLADEIGERGGHMLARGVVGRARLAELEAELRGRIVERLHCGEGHHQPLRHGGEGELHLEALVRHRQVPELILEDDGHLLRILLLEPLGDGNAVGDGIEGDVEMVLAREPVALDLGQHVTNHAAQGGLSEKVVSQFVVCHERPGPNSAT